MSKLWKWVKSLFAGDKIGIVWRTIFTAAKSTVAQMVCDPDNQKAALYLVKHLASADMTNEQRQAEFNAQMKSWAKAAGKNITEAAINALRENAVIASKCDDCRVEG